MDIGKLTVALLSAFMIGCASQPADNSREHDYFNKHAMAVCIGAAFSDATVKSDFNKSANGYMERGNMPLEAYEEVRALAREWLNKDYPSKQGGQVESAKCFDFIESNDLNQLYQKYDPCRYEDGWLSETTFYENCG